MSEYATVGPIPGPDRCDRCGVKTVDSALCAKCAWQHYDAMVEEWNGTLRERLAEWTADEEAP